MTDALTKRRARSAVMIAKARGTLVEPERCEDCGQLDVLQAHHDDYGMPLDVLWLCRSCHADAHRSQGPTDTKLGAWLARNRWPQTRLARLLGVGQQQVSRWVTGQSIPRPRYVVQIHRITGGKVTATDWFGDLEKDAA